MTMPEQNPIREAAVGISAAWASEVPIVGAIVDSTLAVLAARQRQRDEEWWASVVARVDLTEERLEAIARGEDEEFVASALRIGREAQETADVRRREMLARVLANCGSWSDIPYDEREELLPIVLRLTSRQVVILRFLDSPAHWFAHHGIRVLEAEQDPVDGIGFELGQLVIRYLMEDPDIDIMNDQYSKFREAAGALDRAGLAHSALSTEVPPGQVLGPRLTPLGRQVLRFLGYQTQFP
jgi:hypothetical protein